MGFILKGGIAYSKDLQSIESVEQGYVVCADGICKGVYKSIPEEYASFPVKDYSNCLIVPGMTDLHVHAPQYTFRGIGMDCQLLDWLRKYTFPEEANYADLDYAKEAYGYFAEDLRRCFTTRAVIFATIHNDATVELMDLLEQTGLQTYVGRVNMDRNGGVNLEEADADTSIAGTVRWLEQIAGRYQNTKAILTPRFIPSCSDDLMRGIGKLSKERHLRIQSHLSENPSEITWVKELVPESDCYANAYELFDSMGTPMLPAIMAHCVYSDERELDIMKKHGTYVAHCADSNLNLMSGVAPVRRMLEKGLHVGLGTDVAAGSSMNMLRTMLTTLQVSKMYYRLVDSDCRPLTFEEVFYLATLGGGQYFGKVGSFEEGYDFDAVVIEDSLMKSMRDMSVRERVERMVYNDADCLILQKFVQGKSVFERNRR